MTSYHKSIIPERYCVDLEFYPKQAPPKFNWNRNIRDCYRELSDEDIQKELKDQALPFSILISQVESDFNCGAIIRAANNFLVSNIYYFGPSKKWDKRSALGAHKYIPVQYLPTLDEIKKLKNKYKFIGLENNIEKTIPLQEFDWPKNSLLVFGEENLGIIPEVMGLLDYVVEIPTMGSIRSLNVGCAAAIAMYDFVAKFKNRAK